jgi:hypothetical protein
MIKGAQVGQHLEVQDVLLIGPKPKEEGKGLERKLR